MKQVAVIGGGASGMMAAVAALQKGAQVTIIDHGEKLGKKLLATGNGRCNYTNRRMDAKCFHNNPAAMTVIRKFDTDRTLAFFQKLGIWPRERNGYYYPSSDQAVSVHDALERQVTRLGADIRLQETVRRIDCSDRNRKNNKKDGRNRFSVHLADSVLETDALILAAGGMALPVSGSDGSGYDLARAFGHTVKSPLPALTGIVCQEKFFKKLAGIRLQARVKLLIDGRAAAEDTGEVQLTAYGISGIPVFQVSRYASRAFAWNKKVEASLDLVPMMTEQQLQTYLSSHRPEQYQGLFNSKLVPVLLERYGKECGRLAAGIRDFRVHCNSVKGFEQAQVTCGGVDCQEIELETMESRLQPGLYFAGEILDVDGICGGYNLQWAWSSGWLAGSSAAGVKRTKNRQEAKHYDRNSAD